MDNGSQYLSEHFQNQIKFWGIAPSFAFVREPETNGVVERFNRTLKEQVIYGRTFKNIEEVRAAMDAFVTKYKSNKVVNNMVNPRYLSTAVIQAHVPFTIQVTCTRSLNRNERLNSNCLLEGRLRGGRFNAKTRCEGVKTRGASVGCKLAFFGLRRGGENKKVASTIEALTVETTGSISDKSATAQAGTPIGIGIGTFINIQSVASSLENPFRP